MAACRHPPRRLYGYDVRYSSRVGDGSFGGMNCYAARELGYSYPYPCSSVLVDRNQSCRKIEETILHEAFEANAMKRLKLPYKKAHRLAIQMEKRI